MRTLIIGGIVSLIAGYFTTEGMKLEIFLNFHSFVIVVLGSIAVLFIGTPMDGIKKMFKALLELVRSKEEHQKIKIEHYIESLTMKKYNDVPDFHPLVVMAKDLWEQGIDSKAFEYLLEQKLMELNQASEAPVAVMKNIAKYPPALGMMGTVMGMVALFSNLTAENKSNIGADLALAMTATFYGLLMANMFIMPLADRLVVQHQSHLRENEVIFNTLLLVNNDEPLSIVENLHVKKA